EEVIRLRGELESNRNPRLVKQAEKRKATEAMTVESVIRAWYEAYCVKNKKGSEQILRSFELHLFSKIGNIPHDTATLHDWLEVLEPLSTKTPAIADRLLINAKQAHVWAYKRKLIETRPLSDITGKDMDIRKGQKKRFLTHDEIKILYAAIDGSRMVPKYRAFIKLLLHFGCRSSELITARVDDFDFINKVWTVPPERHKTGAITGEPLKRPIIEPVEELIKYAISMNNGSDMLFTKEGSREPVGRTSLQSLPYNLMQYAWRRLGYQFPHWSLHDLRRTARTNFSDLTAPHIAEIMLGHKLPGVWQVYDKSDYLEEQRKAYQAWWERVESIVTRTSSDSN
ncbi:tyrosine-type recombinase/integrase, partial [Escherichia coli]|nr:tyrosine-type recombinase/integrase [Escherichia coli]EGJ9812283.1 tyrosine-type recombinase/integrase [Escherichia coli]HCB7186079.1 tyrosine-type recombinase/integrase [Escherichia coli]HCB7801331.1 tyrosine-type recombinase/integrase [Escherichia coli]HDJ0442429.1 tyrosine-type recombinase/integrase [Escherichia coli]